MKRCVKIKHIGRKPVKMWTPKTDEHERNPIY